MPLTEFQKVVLRLLAAQRKPESHVAGGAALNRSADSPRYSADLDIFHDAADSVLQSAEADVALLISQGFVVEWQLRQPFLQRARVARGAEQLKLEWCYDSAFRFFPIQSDPEFGYCLHPTDLATNKMLALAGRSEVRDFLDVLYLHRSYLSVGALCWAACGKDQGFTPASLLEHAKRNVRFRQEDLDSEHLVQPLRLTELKEAWLAAVERAETLCAGLPVHDVGCLYLNAEGAPTEPALQDSGFVKLQRHFGSLRGAWPRAVHS